jgi:hypothetical protein
MVPAFIYRTLGPRFLLDTLRSSERNRMHLIAGSNEANGDCEQVSPIYRAKMRSTLSLADRSEWHNHPTGGYFFKTSAN